MEWKLYSFVIRGKTRRAVFLLLDKPRTPSEISKELKISTTHASRALKELRGKKLVECMTPKEKTGRIYKVTKKGEKLFKVMSEL